MTYESLMIANQTITKIEVKGKEYAEVNKEFVYFECYIRTEVSRQILKA